jgi:23S rRNA pseudouridine2605 synthase
LRFFFPKNIAAGPFRATSAAHVSDNVIARVRSQIKMRARAIPCIAAGMAETPDKAPKTEPRTEQRIAKLLARAGIASRREIERMIADGRIAVDGNVIDTPATLLRSLHGVAVDGQPVAAPPPAQLFLYHKPPGLLVTEYDPGGRPTIYDQLPADLPRLVPVGRLDLATEGLLLLTTDGGLKRQLELPATGVERAYRARTYGEISQTRLEELIEGIEIEGIRYGPIDANLERRTGANVWIEMILTEGKNREVRRVLEHLGLQVSRLIRTRYGPFLLGDLKPGEVGEVRQHDLVAFRRTLDKPGERGEPIKVDARIAGGRSRAVPAARSADAPARDRPARPRDGSPAPSPRPTGDRPPRSFRPGAAPGASMNEQRPRPARDAVRPARADDRPQRPSRSGASSAAPGQRPRPDRAGARPERARSAPGTGGRANDREQRRPNAESTDRRTPRPTGGRTDRAQFAPATGGRANDREQHRPGADTPDRWPPRPNGARPDRLERNRDQAGPARAPGARPARAPGKPPASPRPGGGRGPGKR